MSQDAKVITGIGIVTLIIIIIGAVFLSNGSVGSTTSSSSSTQELDSTKASNSLLVPKGSFQSGPSNAPVTFVEFGDFECPGCGAMYPIVKQLKQQYGNKINLVFRNFPLVQIHKNAMIGAQAAVAAGQQGKFWPMHDILYDNQDTWATSSNPKSYFDTYAKKIGLNVSKFDEALNSNAVIDQVNKDEADGNTLQVNETPTFYINQRHFVGNYTYTDLKSAIDSQLKK